jgi:hypothetical protein
MEDWTMKKIFFILAVMLVINQNTFSQDAEKKITIQSSPLLWFSDIFTTDGEMLFAVDLEGQFKITNSVNLSLALSFLIDNHMAEDYSDDYNRESPYKENIYQINIKPMFIYRPFETGLKGFYLGFYPNVGLLHVGNEYENLLFTELGFGINWGYKWVFRSGFTMQVGNGIGKTFSIPEGSRRYVSVNSDGRISLSYTDIYLLDFKLGYSF